MDNTNYPSKRNVQHACCGSMKVCSRLHMYTSTSSTLFYNIFNKGRINNKEGSKFIEREQIKRRDKKNIAEKS